MPALYGVLVLFYRLRSITNLWKVQSSLETETKRPRIRIFIVRSWNLAIGATRMESTGIMDVYQNGFFTSSTIDKPNVQAKEGQNEPWRGDVSSIGTSRVQQPMLNCHYLVVLNLPWRTWKMKERNKRWQKQNHLEPKSDQLTVHPPPRPPPPHMVNMIWRMIWLSQYILMLLYPLHMRNEGCFVLTRDFVGRGVGAWATEPDLRVVSS